MRVEIDRAKVLDVSRDNIRDVAPRRARVARHAPGVTLSTMFCQHAGTITADEQRARTYHTRAPVPHICVAPNAEVELEGPTSPVQCRSASLMSTSERHDTQVQRISYVIWR